MRIVRSKVSGDPVKKTVLRPIQEDNNIDRIIHEAWEGKTKETTEINEQAAYIEMLSLLFQSELSLINNYKMKGLY